MNCGTGARGRRPGGFRTRCVESCFNCRLIGNEQNGDSRDGNRDRNQGGEGEIGYRHGAFSQSLVCVTGAALAIRCGSLPRLVEQLPSNACRCPAAPLGTQPLVASGEGISHRNARSVSCAGSGSCRRFIRANVNWSRWAHEKTGLKDEAGPTGACRWRTQQLSAVSPGTYRSTYACLVVAEITSGSSIARSGLPMARPLQPSECRDPHPTQAMSRCRGRHRRSRSGVG